MVNRGFTIFRTLSMFDRKEKKRKNGALSDKQRLQHNYVISPTVSVVSQSKFNWGDFTLTGRSTLKHDICSIDMRMD